MRDLLSKEIKRLKLFDDRLFIHISSHDKERLRELAYSRNMTISNYVRNLIFIELGKSQLKNLNREDEFSEKEAEYNS